MAKLTVFEFKQEIASTTKERWLVVYSFPGKGGSFVARIKPKTGKDGTVVCEARFYYRYSVDGKRVHYPIGTFDEKGTNGGYTLAQAYSKADDLKKTHGESATKDVREVKRAEAIEAEQKRKQVIAEEAERQRQEKAGALRDLLELYVGYLETKTSQQSAKDARSLFRVHVYQAWPELADKKANQITLDEVIAVVSEVENQGKGRQAGKLRSYLRAAYARALEAKSGNMPGRDALLAMNISINPVAQMGTRNLKQYLKAGERVLSPSELGIVLRKTNAMNPGTRAAIRLMLLLGGQRAQQLLRATPIDTCIETGTITLNDPKGRRVKPRKHLLPLFGEALELVAQQLASRGECPTLFTSDGKIPMTASHLSHTITDLCTELVNEGVVEHRFTLRDLRRTCETRLSQLGVIKDIRARVLSHGISGVQDNHYDMHDYMPEKIATLRKWADYLAQLEAGGNVVPLFREVA